MHADHTVLLLGATGRTGRRVLQQLLGRGARVRAIVRSRARLPPGTSGHPHLTVIEASLLSLGDGELQAQLAGCDAVVSCLGHVLNLRGVFGPPRDLVTSATARLCRAIRAGAPAVAVKLVLMSSVSVHRPGAADARRGALVRAFLRGLCAVLPPARDNQRAADFLLDEIGRDDGFVQWAVVRPDTLREGDVSHYEVHAGLVNGLFAPGRTRMANVAHFMCELVTDPRAWEEWKGELPVITDAESPDVTTARAG